MATVVDFTDATFPTAVLKAPLPVLVSFRAEWSAVCKALEQELAKVATERAGKVTVGRLDIDQNPATPPQYEVDAIPTLYLFKGGAIVASRIGPASKANVLALIDPHL
ncbi:thioredoxin family protein [Nonomuraea sp. NPDC004297]